ncbi:hypothetical protein OJJOAM_003777 [Cupriavidus sp. H18C1]
MQRRQILRLAGAAWAAGVAGMPVGRLHAEDFPSRPIKLIVPYGAGGITDQIGRALADAAGRELGQSIIVENKPGVSGTLGATQMATSEPDGYTLTMAPVVIFRLPHVQKMRYDPLKDLTYISMIADYNFAVAVRTDAKWKTMQELVAEAKASSRGISYGTTGIYGSQHLTISELARITQSNWTHVPYKGDAEAITSLLGGQCDVAMLTNTLLPYVKNGQLRVLAVLSEKRAPDFPRCADAQGDRLSGLVQFAVRHRRPCRHEARGRQEARHRVPQCLEGSEAAGGDAAVRHVDQLHGS